MNSENRIRCVFDTNVLISAFVFGGFPEKLVRLVYRRRIHSLTCKFILNEFYRVCTAKKLLSAWESEQAINRWSEFSEQVELRSKVRLIRECASDNHILECAIDGHADFIVTGDRKHLLPLKTYRGVKIVTVRELIQQAGLRLLTQH